MTREESLNKIGELVVYARAQGWDSEFTEAFETLSAEPCEDAISRQAVLEYIEGSYAELGHSSENELVCQDIKEMPPVTPQQKTGHWYIDERPESNREVTCSNCDQPIFKYHRLDFDYRPKYCPNCGARMEKNEKDKIRQGCYWNR